MKLSDESSLPKTSFAFSYTVGRLLMFAGRKAEATAWLDRIRPQFSHTPTYLNMERQVSEMPDDMAN